MATENQKLNDGLRTVSLKDDNITSPTDVEQNGPTKTPYPMRVLLILGNEFCERFTFYGMVAILVLYMTQKLEMDDDSATIVYHSFQMLVYLMCTIGAIISDTWLGKFKTIFYLSILYVCGSLLISFGAIPGGPIPANVTLFVGILLIAFGSGGIKPCVATFGGDQFKLPEQAKQLTLFFSLFYFAINSGSLISMTLTPMLREDVHCFGENDCYSLAFGVPAILMIIALVVFLLGKPLYRMIPPSSNMVVNVFSCIKTGIVQKQREKKRNPREHFLDYAIPKHGRKLVADTKILLRILVLYIPLPVFYALYDQQGSRWIMQALRMDGDVGLFTIKPDQIQVFNPLLILGLIPLYETVLYPLLSKVGINTPLRKLTLGGFLAAAAFIVSGIVEMQLEADVPILPSATNAQFRVFNGYPCNYTGQSEQFNFTLKQLDAYQVQQFNIDAELPVHLTFEREHENGNANCPKQFRRTVILKPDEATSIFVTGKSQEDSHVYADSPDKTRTKKPGLRFLVSSTVTRKLLIRNQNRHDHILMNSDTNNRTLVEGVPNTYEIVIDDKVIGAVTVKQGSVSTVIVSELNDGTFIFNLVYVVSPNSMSLLWLLPQYVILTLGEVMFNVTGLAFSYSQAPESMKSVIQAFWLFTNACGDALLMLIVSIKVFDLRSYEFFLFSALMAADMLLFMFLAHRYKSVKYEDDEEDSSK